MKELSTEEKAKAYDEAIKVAESIHRFSSDPAEIKRMEQIFPELEESEDERIRKALVEMVHDTTGDSLWVDYNVHKEDALAWLEKQGKQKLVQETEPTPIFKIGDILKRKGKDYTFRVDRIQGGYYHCDRNHGAFFPIEEQGLWQLVAQKPAWSEEDEVGLGDAMWAIEQARTIAKDENDMGNLWYAERWLKSLKDRVWLQPKQEWGEEDNIILSRIIADYERSNEEWFNAQNSLPHGRKINWLKSIRPQNTWKPSEEQMDALKHASNDCSIAFADMKILATLYEQLKKLMKE